MKQNFLDKHKKGDDKYNLSNIESDVFSLVKIRKNYINNPNIDFLNKQPFPKNKSISQKFALNLQSIFSPLIKRN